MTAAIRCERLTKRFGSTTALDNLDLEVESGEVFGYLGPNGAGKTTTIRLLLDLARPSSGSAWIGGFDCQTQTQEVHRRVAFVPSDIGLWPSLTGAETLELLGRVHGQVDEKYRDALIDRFHLDITKRVRTYSSGNRQKVVLIAALMTRADLLVLDEPTTGLDPLMEQAFRASIDDASQRGQTVFLSSHLLAEVEAVCDRIGILRDGQLVEIGTMADMRHLASLKVDATFAAMPPDVSGVPGVADVVVEERRLSCRVTGSIEPLLAALADTGLERFVSREPSLEELFLQHYSSAPLPSTSDAA